MNDSGDALFPVFTQDEDEESISNDANTDPSVPASSSRRLNHSVNEGPSELPLKIEGVNGQFYYRSNKVLGRGAFGDVYLAVGETGAFFALKTIVVTINSTEQLVHEVEALTKLRNENVVAYDTCGVDGTYFFIITEYLSAGSMQDLVQRLGVIPVKAIRRYCRDILMGLHFLHENKYNHCDIKPDNILLTSEGTCKLADFGAAVLQFSTHKPSIRGTPRFMAPEAVLGVFTPQSDVYSFGLSVVQMMTGKHPWHHYPDGDSMFLVKYTGALRESLEKKTPCTMQPDLPKEYEDVELLQMVQRCCAYAPEERPTVAELLTFLS
ncbi:hypothetical protein AGDE_15047 [Angomonas deanei]|nr:hypothetical protein AGDE_15047 [Angomonas deanei]|eukprot:EPY19773.1 hypothetical protein AGDE_15047 [Angomonas deanei]